MLTCLEMYQQEKHMAIPSFISVEENHLCFEYIVQKLKPQYFPEPMVQDIFCCVAHLFSCPLQKGLIFSMYIYTYIWVAIQTYSK